MYLPTPTTALHLAVLACALGALDGTYGLISPKGAARGPGLDLTDDASAAPLRALSGARLASHAATLAVLTVFPSVGACMAAGLACGWLGAAAGRAVSILVERKRRPADLLRVLGAAAMGVALWMPLWLYLSLMQGMAEGRYGA
ncbi:DUF4345 family protein [soil metagenome]